MKRKLFAVLAVSTVVFASCSSDKDPIVTPPVDGNELTELNGSISGNAVVKGNTINLKGATIVRAGSTLTIPAGTTITATDKNAYLLIEKDAKIIAKGTSSAPITFTSTTKNSGGWGGLVINGNAPLSRATESAPSTFPTEINDQIQYGGNKADDNSGELDYVVIEYSGSNITQDKEHNGLTLNGVGNGTKISNIFIKSGADDGIEFFGGTVNVTNLLVVNSEDDMFDFTQGYTGTISNAYGIWESSFTTNEEDPRGIEADGNHDGNTPTAFGQSNFKINDMTIVHKATAAGTAGTMKEIVKIRRGAKVTLNNLLIQMGETAKFGSIFDFTDGKGNGDKTSTVIYSFNPTSLFDIAKIKNPEGVTLTKNDTQTGANTTAFSWTKYSF